MSTVAQVKSAWNTAVWAHSTIIAITPKIYNFDALSLSPVGRMQDNQLKNGTSYEFFQYRVTRHFERAAIGGSRLFRYPVTIQYYIEADKDGANHAAGEAVFETIDGLVISELTDTWSATVDSYDQQVERPAFSEVLINDVVCWSWTYEYVGIKWVS